MLSIIQAIDDDNCAHLTCGHTVAFSPDGFKVGGHWDCAACTREANNRHLDSIAPPVPQVITASGERPKLHIHQRPDDDSRFGTFYAAPGTGKTGKPLAGILYEDFPLALSAVVDVATFGAEKHSRSGWTDTPDGIRAYTDAMHRHLLAEARGETVDDDGVHHAAAAGRGNQNQVEFASIGHISSRRSIRAVCHQRDSRGPEG